MTRAFALFKNWWSRNYFKIVSPVENKAYNFVVEVSSSTSDLLTEKKNTNDILIENFLTINLLNIIFQMVFGSVLYL